MKKKILIISSIVVVLSLAFIFYWKKYGGGAKAEDVSKNKTSKPFLATIARKIITTGTIVPKKEVDIKPPVSGIVEEIFVGVGQKVKRGDPLVKIKLIPDLENLSNAESGLRIAKINVEDAERELQRQQKLFEVGAIAETDLIKAKRDFKVAEENIKQCENRLQVIKEGAAKEYSQVSNIIAATCDGVVLDIFTKQGGSIMGRGSFNEGTTLISIADMNQLIFQGKVGESDVDHLKEGMEIELTIGAIEKEKFKGIIMGIAPKGKDEQGSVKFDFSASVVPKDGKIIRAGYSANATIILEKKDNVMAIKESDLQFNNDSAFAEIKDKKGVFQKKYISTGISDGMNIQVTGLTLNDVLRKIPTVIQDGK